MQINRLQQTCCWIQIKPGGILSQLHNVATPVLPCQRMVKETVFYELHDDFLTQTDRLNTTKLPCGWQTGASTCFHEEDNSSVLM